MPSFHYIALNQTGSELSGVIEAPDEPQARKNLNRLGLSVVSLNTVDGVAPATAAAGQASASPTFEFEAVDKNAKKVVGTIRAENLFKAFGRLFEEYEFNVNYIIDDVATAPEKTAARKAGIVEIQKEYEKSLGKNAKKAVDTSEQESVATEKKELLQKVDYTMTKMQEFLQQYAADLRVEQRDTIQGYLNQLVRIKDSTNLEHIRSTCARMLDHIQKQEIFLHEEQRHKESSQFKVETKELLSQLKRTGLQQEIDLVQTATKWQEIPFLKPLATWLLKLFKAQNPEIRKLREEIKVINHHFWSYVKLLIIGKSKMVRQEAWESIKTLRAEKKRLKLQLTALQMEAQRTEIAAQQPSFLSDTLPKTISWILAFYLAAYVISYPFTIKQFPITSLPRSFFFYHSKLMAPLLLLLFCLHIAFTVHQFWLKNKGGMSFLLLPATLFVYLLMLVNLM
ncbi:MAG: hypothetical protein AAB588_04645 [Patescibacteria group bacterium]